MMEELVIHVMTNALIKVLKSNVIALGTDGGEAVISASKVCVEKAAIVKSGQMPNRGACATSVTIERLLRKQQPTETLRIGVK